MTNEEAIEILGGIRACYNIFDEWDRGKYHALSMAIEALKSQKHGRWIYKEYRTTIDDVIGFYLCSECGHANWIKEDNYCQFCGAKMDGGEEQ